MLQNPIFSEYDLWSSSVRRNQEFARFAQELSPHLLQLFDLSRKYNCILSAWAVWHCIILIICALNKFTGENIKYWREYLTISSCPTFPRDSKILVFCICSCICICWKNAGLKINIGTCPDVFPRVEVKLSTTGCLMHPQHNWLCITSQYCWIVQNSAEQNRAE